MARKGKRHFLFVDEFYEKEYEREIKFDFTLKEVDKVIRKWCENLDYHAIAKAAQINEVECLLLLIDLQMTGKLPKRARDFYGRKTR